MQVLFVGIYSKYNGSTALKAAITGLYLSEAIQTAVYPYGVYNLISDVPSWTFDAGMEGYVIQFNLYSDNSSSTAVNTAFTALTGLFDDSEITVSGYTHIFMKREISLLTRESDVWNYMVQYRIKNQKY